VLHSQNSPHPTTVDLLVLVEAAPERMKIPNTVWTPRVRLPRLDFVARDAANRDLGHRGEELVLEFEQKRLHDVERRPDLAKRVEWTSQVRGDGAGYDVSSFNSDGSRRVIEVKTTGLGKYFPFNITANEVRCSEALPDEFQLYRVFNFGPDARLYQLPGPVSRTCHLDPAQYRAFVESPGS